MGRATRSITASTAVAVPDSLLDSEREAREALSGLDDDLLLEVLIDGASNKRVTARVPVALLRRYLESLEVPGRELLVFDSDEEVSSEVGAQLLGVSRPYLNELLEAEAIPYRRVGNQRRIRVIDLDAYRQRRQQRERALRAMADVVNESDSGWG
jgi:excisionase family DNA binding protein